MDLYTQINQLNALIEQSRRQEVILQRQVYLFDNDLKIVFNSLLAVYRQMLVMKDPELADKPAGQLEGAYSTELARMQQSVSDAGPLFGKGLSEGSNSTMS